MWRSWAEQIQTDDATNSNRIFQPFKFKQNSVLRAARAWFVFYGDPSFSNLKLEIYSMSSSSVVLSKITESVNVWQKSQITTEPNAMKELYFNFSELAFVKADWLCIIPRMTGYTFAESSHVSLMSGFPTPPYRDNLVINGMEDLSSCPYAITFIGDKL